MKAILKLLFYNILTFAMLSFAGLGNLYGQCAMCKTTIENNVSAGDVALASKLNLGIMYLLFAPYILVAVIGYLWYKNSKANAKKNKITSYYRR